VTRVPTGGAYPDGMRPILDVLAALEAAGVRAVVVGGVAVVLHGHPRLTVDLDLVLDLARDNVAAALQVLTAQGLVPRLPVAAQAFADPVTRARWVADRALTVFSLHDPDNPLREVDLFAEEPLPFDELWADSQVVEVAGVGVRVASIDHLIMLKRRAGRPQDLADIDALERLRRERGVDDGG
jgi:hypothetical protein